MHATRSLPPSRAGSAGRLALVYAVLIALLVAVDALAAPAHAQAPATRPAPTARGGRPLSVGDSLGAVVRWQSTPAGQDSLVVTLPAALDSAIQRVVPGWRLRRTDELLYGAAPLPGLPTASPVAVVADLDGDGRREAVLLGAVPAENAPTADTAFVGDGQGRLVPGDIFRGIDQTVVVLGVRQRAGVYAVTVLRRGRERLTEGLNGMDGPPRSGNLLSLERLTLGGKLPANGRPGPQPWVRYQDGDCKGEGWQWTLLGPSWRRTPSPCTYGD